MKLQIIRNDVHSIFKASDNILAKYGESNTEVPDQIRGQATIATLRRIFDGNHFDVCAVKELAEMNDVVFSKEHSDLFQTLHCVKWELMEEETRNYLLAILVQYFKTNISQMYATYSVEN